MSAPSWDELEADDDVAKAEGVTAEEKDFLADVQAADTPKACSIDQPDCEACQ